MIEDHNKTEATKAVTKAAINYLNERGCKPIETEVPVDRAWVADVATVMDPTMTELILLKLIKRRPGWEHPEYDEWQNTLRRMRRFMTALVEVKTSVSDFRCDGKWNRPQPTNLCYLAIPNELRIAERDYPECWGVLSYSRGADCVRCIRVPTVKEVTTKQQLDVTLQIAWRRDNHTRNARLGEFNREIRKEQNLDISRTRLSTAIKAVESIIKGEHGTPEDALAWHGIRQPPDYLLERLRKLWGATARQD